MKFLCLGLLLLCLFVVQAQETKHRLVFYNVENLFDTKDDPDANDDEFTPNGAKHWTLWRYRDKLSKIAVVLKGAGGGIPPAFVGLVEVENREVLEDLITQKELIAENYGIIHRDSPDERGIDVAFLYRKSLFKPLKTDFFKITLPADPMDKTRDILYVSGLLGAETLHFFVCHFPSMYGGEKKSEWKRIHVAGVLRHKIDSIKKGNPEAKIVVLGDLNGKADTDAQKALGARSSDEPVSPGGLYNTGYYLLNKEYGSYRYRGKWQTLDHIIVSAPLLGGKGVQSSPRLSVFSPSFLLEEDNKNGGRKPFLTYRGPIYVGGYSDHLPVYIDLYQTAAGKK